MKDVNMNDPSPEQIEDIEKIKAFKTRSKSLNAPCPCKSGKKFKNCHLPLIKILKNRIAKHERENEEVAWRR